MIIYGGKFQGITGVYTPTYDITAANTTNTHELREEQASRKQQKTRDNDYNERNSSYVFCVVQTKRS